MRLGAGRAVGAPSDQFVTGPIASSHGKDTAHPMPRNTVRREMAFASFTRRRSLPGLRRNESFLPASCQMVDVQAGFLHTIRANRINVSMLNLVLQRWNNASIFRDRRTVRQSIPAARKFARNHRAPSR